MKPDAERFLGPTVDLRSDPEYRFGPRTRSALTAIGWVVLAVSLLSLAVTALEYGSREFPVSLCFAPEEGFFVHDVDPSADPALEGSRVIAIEGVPVSLERLATGGATELAWASRDGRVGVDSVRAAIRGKSRLRLDLVRDPDAAPRNWTCRRAPVGGEDAEPSRASAADAPDTLAVSVEVTRIERNWFVVGADLVTTGIGVVAGPAVLLAAAAPAHASWAPAVVAAGVAMGSVAVLDLYEHFDGRRHPLARRSPDLVGRWILVALATFALLALSLIYLARRASVSFMPSRALLGQWIAWLAVAGTAALVTERIDRGGLDAVVAAEPAWFSVPLLMLVTAVGVIGGSVIFAIGFGFLLPFVAFSQNARRTLETLEPSAPVRPLVLSLRLSSALALGSLALVLGSFFLLMVVGIAGDLEFDEAMAAFARTFEGASEWGPALALVLFVLPFMLPFLGATLSLSDRLRWSAEDLLRRTTLVSLLAAGGLNLLFLFEELMPPPLQNDLVQASVSLVVLFLLGGPVAGLTRKLAGTKTVDFGTRLTRLRDALATPAGSAPPAEHLGTALESAFESEMVAVYPTRGVPWSTGEIPEPDQMGEGLRSRVAEAGWAKVLTDAGPLLALPIGPQADPAAVSLLGPRGDGTFYSKREREQLGHTIGALAPLFLTPHGGGSSPHIPR